MSGQKIITGLREAIDLTSLVRPLVWEDSLKGRWVGTPPVRLGDMAFWIFSNETSFARFTSGGKIAYPTLEAAKAAAQADYAARLITALDPAALAAMLAEAREQGRGEAIAALSDRDAVHINMLRGTIANPTVEQIIHIYGADVLDAAIRARGVKS